MGCQPKTTIIYTHYTYFKYANKKITNLKLSLDVGFINKGVQHIEDTEDIPCFVLSVQGFNFSWTQLGGTRPKTLCI